jgi:tripartite ATP-independent transporter DctP family solute receptor
MKKIAVILIMALIGSLAFAGGQTEASKGQGTEAVKKVTLKMGMIAATGHAVEIGSTYFAKLVKERTNGEVEIQVYPDGTLGNEVELQNAAKLGTVDIINVGCGITSGTIPQYNIASFHYCWKSPEHMHAVMSSDLVKGWDEESLKKSGLRILASNWEQGNRHVASKKPIRSIDDVKGLKIRVPQAEAFIAAWKALGANPAPMAFGEVYTALQQGVVDAVEVPLDWIANNKFYEQAKYIILTGHLQYVNQVQINEKTFQKLSPKNQEILIQAAKEAGDLSTETGRKVIAGLQADLESKGAIFIEVDRSKFQEKIMAIVPDFEKQWGVGLWDQVQKIGN